MRRAVPPLLLALAAAVALGGCVTLVTTTPGPDEGRSLLPSGRPTPTPARTVFTYVIDSGDTLLRIARRFRITLGQLLAANPDIRDPDRIRVGQAITIPPPDAPETGPDTASISDPLDDALGPDDELVSAPVYADIRRVSARLERSALIVSVTLDRVPPPVDPAAETLLYSVIIDTSGDGQPDWQLGYGNAVDGSGGYAAALQATDGGSSRSGAQFPGRVEARVDTIRWRIPLAALSRPDRVALAARAERTFRAADPAPISSIDYAPDQQWPRRNPRWLDLELP